MNNMKSMTRPDLSVLRKTAAAICFLLLTGCALFPPPPAQCNGQFRPVNAPPVKVDASSQPVADSVAGNKGGELDKTLRNQEGVADGN